MADHTSTPVTPVLPCLRCNYDLRGLSPASACPECGLAVSFSLSPPTTLSAAPPSWARTLAIGAGLLFLSIVLVPITRPLLDALVPYDVKAPFAPQYQLHDVIMAAMLAFHALAVWVVTVREPRTPRLSRRRLAVWVARLCVLGPAAAFIFQISLRNFSFLSRYQNLSLLFDLLYIPLPALVFLHLRRLSTRIGRPRLAEHAGIVGVGFSVCLLTIILIPVLSEWLGWEKYLFPVMLLPVACFILGYFWGLFLLLRLTVAFARAVGEARATWTHADATATPPTSATGV